LRAKAAHELGGIDINGAPAPGYVLDGIYAVSVLTKANIRRAGTEIPLPGIAGVDERRASGLDVGSVVSPGRYTRPAAAAGGTDLDVLTGGRHRDIRPRRDIDRPSDRIERRNADAGKRSERRRLAERRRAGRIATHRVGRERAVALRSGRDNEKGEQEQ